MSETVHQHYRTGTFPATLDGGPETVELRWYRDGQIVHLTVPPLASAALLAQLPDWIVPSRDGAAAVQGGAIAYTAATRMLSVDVTDFPGGTIDYLSIPGQAVEG